MTHKENSAELVSELERRIQELERSDDEAFGTFTQLDWLLLILVSLVIPVIVAVVFR